jgi:hypothetical protein
MSDIIAFDFGRMILAAEQETLTMNSPLKRSFTVLVLAATMAAPLGLPAAAQPYRGRPDYHRDYRGGGYYHGGPGPGAVVGGALLGLGVGAVIGSALRPPPAVVYAPPPTVVYAPPPPVVYYGN